MQILIPMSGIGSRFIQAGYTEPKPLIEIDGKPIIEHVVDMFPGESDFTFICNSKHLAETQMALILRRIVPDCRIIEIAPHKLGPVYAVLKAKESIDDKQEVIVSYCDFGSYWNYQDFLDHTRSRKADGAIPSYQGFHPHMLGTTNYAFIRDESQWMQEIQEKKPFTNNRMNEYASNGVYYFRKGSFLKNFFQKLMDNKTDLNGEYYVSMVFNLLIDAGLNVSIYEIQHMLQWGTPQDVEEYNTWSNCFKRLAVRAPDHKMIDCQMVIPLAGRGKRFTDQGYELPKPLIPVSGQPMVIQASDMLPQTLHHTFVCLDDHLDKYPLADTLRSKYVDAQIISVDKITEGQACTANLGIADLADNSPLLVGACDNGMLFNRNALQQLFDNPDVDAIVFSVQGHSGSIRRPQMYGWLKLDDSKVTGVSVKEPVSDTPGEDHTIIGAFWFRSAKLFKEALEVMIQNDIKVNNEFYIDSMVGVLAEAGYRVHAFPVDHYICWGTPEELLTFNYWQSFFHKAPWHPYQLSKDRYVSIEAVFELDKKYRTFTQEHR